MGIRESLLNTITSVGNGDFIRIVTSAGASSKATLQNVIKSFETGLGAKTSLTTSDYIRVVGSDNNLYKQSVSAVKTAMGVDNKIGSSPTGTAGKLTDLLLSRDSQGPYISVWSTDDTSQRIGYFRLASSKVTVTYDAPTGTSNGNLQYQRTGNAIVFSGSMYVSAAVANGTVLFSGLPVPHGGIAGFRCICSTTGNWYDFYINSDGTVRAASGWPALGWYRFAGAYVD